MSRVAFISSNQPRNAYASMQGVSEEDVMQEITSKAASMLQQDGVQVGGFHVPGEGRSSTDELQRMSLAAEEYGPDVVFSLHSDSVRTRSRPECSCWCTA